jgi:hypothetical protein
MSFCTTSHTSTLKCAHFVDAWSRPLDVSNSAQFLFWHGGSFIGAAGSSPSYVQANFHMRPVNVTCVEPGGDLSSYLMNPKDTKMYMSGESLLIILVVGVIAGWLSGHIVQGTGFGIVEDLFIGIVGTFIGSCATFGALYCC